MKTFIIIFALCLLTSLTLAAQQQEGIKTEKLGVNNDKEKMAGKWFATLVVEAPPTPEGENVGPHQFKGREEEEEAIDRSFQVMAPPENFVPQNLKGDNLIFIKEPQYVIDHNGQNGKFEYYPPQIPQAHFQNILNHYILPQTHQRNFFIQPEVPHRNFIPQPHQFIRYVPYIIPVQIPQGHNIHPQFNHQQFVEYSPNYKQTQEVLVQVVEKPPHIHHHQQHIKQVVQKSKIASEPPKQYLLEEQGAWSNLGWNNLGWKPINQPNKNYYENSKPKLQIYEYQNHPNNQQNTFIYNKPPLHNVQKEIVYEEPQIVYIEPPQKKVVKYYQKPHHTKSRESSQTKYVKIPSKHIETEIPKSHPVVETYYEEKEEISPNWAKILVPKQQFIFTKPIYTKIPQNIPPITSKRVERHGKPTPPSVNSTSEVVVVTTSKPKEWESQHPLQTN